MKRYDLLLGLIVCGQLFGKANLIDYVKRKYEHQFNGISYLYYPATNPKRLLISFAYYGEGRYSAWSWFWQNDEQWKDTSFLFLKDDRNAWYLNLSAQDQTENNFSQLISHIIADCRVTPQQVFTFGASHGGYGAFYYACKMGLKGAIIFNTQVDKESAARALPWPNAFINLGPWVKDLDKVVQNSATVPIVSLNVSSNIKDYSAGYKLLDALKAKNTLVIFRKIPLVHHQGMESFRFTQQYILQEVFFMENQP